MKSEESQVKDEKQVIHSSFSDSYPFKNNVLFNSHDSPDAESDSESQQIVTSQPPSSTFKGNLF